MNTVIDYVKTWSINTWMIIGICCLITIFMVLMDVFLRKREEQYRINAERELEECVNRVMSLAIDVVCDQYRKNKKYNQHDIDETISMIHTVDKAITLMYEK